MHRVHTPLRNPHIGLGLNIYNDAIGPTVTQGALATFAYRIIFPDSKTLFWTGRPAINTVISSGRKSILMIWEDPLFRVQVKNKAVPDANFGIYYYSKKYYGRPVIKKNYFKTKRV